MPRAPSKEKKFMVHIEGRYAACAVQSKEVYGTYWGPLCRMRRPKKRSLWYILRAVVSCATSIVKKSMVHSEGRCVVCAVRSTYWGPLCRVRRPKKRSQWYILRAVVPRAPSIVKKSSVHIEGCCVVCVVHGKEVYDTYWGPLCRVRSS